MRERAGGVKEDLQVASPYEISDEVNLRTNSMNCSKVAISSLLGGRRLRGCMTLFRIRLTSMSLD